MVADGLHVLGAGGWLGSLSVVVLAGIPAAWALPEDARGPAVADLINAFSPTALVFAGIVATTGVFAAWLHVGSVDALWMTTYGRVLLVKLAVLSLVAGNGAYNWLRVKPQLGFDGAEQRIRRVASYCALHRSFHTLCRIRHVGHFTNRGAHDVPSPACRSCVAGRTCRNASVRVLSRRPALIRAVGWRDRCPIAARASPDVQRSH